jgi:hypothetical protein
MKLKRNYKLLVISFIIFYSLSSYQFYEDYNQYLKLKKDGIVTGTKVKYEKKLFSWFYILEFTTTDGKKVIKEGKCGNYPECKSFFDNLKVIYSPEKPNDFLELPYFNKYSLGYKIFFYFGLYGFTGSFIVFIIFNVIIFFKEKDSRDKFLNILKHRSIIVKNT